MINKVINFDAALSEYGVTVSVQTASVYEGHNTVPSCEGLYLCLDAGRHGGTTTSAYIPRKQAKKIIKAMKEVLND